MSIKTHINTFSAELAKEVKDDAAEVLCTLFIVTLVGFLLIAGLVGLVFSFIHAVKITSIIFCAIAVPILVWALIIRHGNNLIRKTD